MDYCTFNKEKWNNWASEKCIWTQPLTHEDFIQAQQGNLPIYLTPSKAVPKPWISNLTGKKILGLASGGGQQCPFFIACGAKVTVFDISEQQLLAERFVAERESYQIELIKGDMTKDFPFNNESFDLIFNPVSTSYIDNLNHFWKECARILKPNGILMTGFTNPTIYLFDPLSSENSLKYAMPFNPFNTLSQEQQDILYRTDGVQFGHSFEEQIGGIVKSGFVIKDFYEDYHPLNNATTNYNTKIGALAARLSNYMPIYFSILAQRNPQTEK